MSMESTAFLPTEPNEENDMDRSNFNDSNCSKWIINILLIGLFMLFVISFVASVVIIFIDIETKDNNSLRTIVEPPNINFNEPIVATKKKKQCGGNVRSKKELIKDEYYVAVPNCWPWIVSLQIRDSGHFCGGALIESKYVLTAASCVANEDIHNFRVGFGIDDLRNVSYDELYEIEKVIIHDDYINNDDMKDLALIVLKDEVFESENVSYLCLPDDEINLVNGEAIVAGWGIKSEFRDRAASYILKQIIVKVQNEETCKNANIEFNSKIQYCALQANQRLTRNVCNSDAGDPLFIYFNDKWQIVGIVSSGFMENDGFSDYCDTKKPAYYTKISYFLSWINSNL